MTTRSTNILLFAILVAILALGFNLVSSGLQLVTIIILLIAFLIGCAGIGFFR